MIKCTFDSSFEYNELHGFYGLKEIDPSYFYKDEGLTLNGTKYWLFIDMPEVINTRKSEVIEAKKQDIKIISLFYDEARFPIVDRLISENLIDKLILFDKQYENRFNIDSYISDYYLSDSVFPDFNENKNGKTCYFGHKQFNRELPKECEHIGGNSLSELYNKASEYTKGYVASTGKGESGGIIYHNKGKFLEMLFCGLQVECQNGLKTINYEDYKNKEINKKDIVILKKINYKVRKDLCLNIIN